MLKELQCFCETPTKVTTKLAGRGCKPGCYTANMKYTRTAKQEQDPLCPVKREQAENREERDALRYSSISLSMLPAFHVTALTFLLIFEAMESHPGAFHVCVLFGIRLGITLDLEL